MKLINHSENNLSHSCFDSKNVMKIYTLNAGETLEVPDNIGKIWLQYPDIEEHVTKEDLEKVKTESKTVNKTVNKTTNKTTKRTAKKK